MVRNSETQTDQSHVAYTALYLRVKCAYSGKVVWLSPWLTVTQNIPCIANKLRLLTNYKK